MYKIDLKRLFRTSTISKELQFELEALIELNEPDSFKKLIHNNLALFYVFLGEKLRWRISSFIKSVKGINRSSSSLLSIKPSFLLEEISKKGGFVNKYPKGFALITHDVDYNTCYKNVSKIALAEYDKGLFSCYNFLMNAGYKVDYSLLRDLRGMGHEVGLHGYSYDLRLAYRKKRIINEKIKRAKNKLEDILGEPIYGFRNHSLILTHTMLEVVSEQGFLYDSGIFPRFKLNGFNAYYCFPFKYESVDLYEIPVTYPQDTELFRLFDLSDQAAIDCYLKRINIIKDLHGFLCLNHHPSIISGRMDYYNKLLDCIKSSGLVNKTPVDVVKDNIVKD